MFRVKGERDKTVETTSLVLQFPQPDHMIDTFLQRLDVAVQHRRVRANTHSMHRPRDLDPSRARNFVPATPRTRSLGKDVGCAAGTPSQTRLASLIYLPFDRLARDLGGGSDHYRRAG